MAFPLPLNLESRILFTSNCGHTPLTELLSTDKPLLTLTSLAVLNNIGALAVRTVEDLYYYCYVERVDVSTSLVKI